MKFYNFYILIPRNNFNTNKRDRLAWSCWKDGVSVSILPKVSILYLDKDEALSAKTKDCHLVKIKFQGLPLENYDHIQLDDSNHNAIFLLQREFYNYKSATIQQASKENVLHVTVDAEILSDGKERDRFWAHADDSNSDHELKLKNAALAMIDKRINELSKESSKHFIFHCSRKLEKIDALDRLSWAIKRLGTPDYPTLDHIVTEFRKNNPVLDKGVFSQRTYKMLNQIVAMEKESKPESSIRLSQAGR